MRRLLIGVVVAVATGLVSAVAWAGNQDVAEQIAANLRNSGQVSGCKIQVKFLDGTAWIQGRVHSQDQRNQALRVVLQTPGVMRVVSDELAVGTTETPSQAGGSGFGKFGASLAAWNPLRRSSESTPADGAQAAVATGPASQRAVPVAMMQPVNPAPTPAAPSPPSRLAEPIPASVPETAAAGTASGVPGAPLPMYPAGAGGAPAPMRYDQPALPNYAWPTYASYPNYAAVTYPRQYSPTAWPYIGPFYPYPQVPLGWRKVALEWSDGWWFLDFKDEPRCCWFR